MLFVYDNLPEVKRYLTEALSLSTAEFTENTLSCVLLHLENASASATSQGRAPVNSRRLVIFNGLSQYYTRKLKSGREGVEEVEAFLQRVLPTIIELALMNIDDIHKTVIDDLEDPKYRWPHESDIPVRVNSVKISRSKIAGALAMMFLCLLKRRESNEYFNQITDYSGIFANLTRKSTTEVTFQMILQYFREIGQCGQPSGCMIFSKLFVRKTSYFPNDFEEWTTKTKRLCAFEIKPTGSMDDDPSMIHVDFANCYIGGHTLAASIAQEEIMFFTHPELQASMLFISCMGPYEAVQMKGHGKFSDSSGYGRSLKFCERNCKSSATEESCRYAVAIDAIRYGADATRQYTKKDVFLALTKALTGFTQVHNIRQTNNSASSHSPTRKPKTPRDLSVIKEYAESLTEKLMEEIWSGLKLVIPDYFGFNVIHYNPLKDSTEEASASNLTCQVDESEPMEIEETIASTGSSSLPVSQPDVASESHSCTELQGLIAKYASDLSTQIIDRSLDIVHKQATRSQSVPEADSCSTSLRRNNSSDGAQSTSADLSSPITQTTLNSVHKPANQPPVTEKGDSGKMPTVELTTSTSNCTVPISVEVEMSVNRGIGSDLPSAPTAIPLHVDISTTVTPNQDVAVKSEVSNTPAPSIDIQVLVTPDGSQASDTVLRSTSPLPRSLPAWGSTKPAAGDGADVSSSASAHSSDGLLSTLPITDSVKQEISAKAMSMAEEILATVYDELRERRRLLIENNISSVDLNAARATSAGVIGQIFNELHTEAENSIPDSEKLLKDSQAETYSDGLVTSVVTGTQAEWLPQASASSSSSGSHSRALLSPCSTPSRPSLSPGGYRDWSNTRNFTRRSSAPVAVRRSSLGSTARRVSEPSFSFRSRSAHSDSVTRLSDYMRREFEEKKRGVSRSSSLSSNGSNADHLWSEFNRWNNDNSRSPTAAPCLRSPKPEKRSYSPCALSSCEEEGDVTSSDNSQTASSAANAPKRQASLILPAITVNRPVGSASCSNLSNSTGDRSSHESVQFDVPNESGSGSAAPASSMQHQYLRLFSEVLAENILHESLGKIRARAEQSEKSRLAVMAEEESAVEEPRISTDCGLQPIATGNWGCGIFNGDPQLKSIIQWAAASMADCPKLYYYTFGDQRVCQLQDVVELLHGKDIRFVMRLLSSYCEKRQARTTDQTLFDFIKYKQANKSKKSH